MVEREIVKVRVVDWGERSSKPGYGIHLKYDDGTSQDVFIGSLKGAEEATREAVEIGEAYILKLMEDAG
jgi:hypothetical protein